MKNTILKLITLTFLLTATITTYAQSPLPSANYTTLYKSGRAAAIVGATYQNAEPTGFAGVYAISGTDTAAFLVDSAGNTVIYNSNDAVVISGDTAWKDYSASSLFSYVSNDTLFTITNDSINSTDDAAFLRAPITFMPGTKLSQFRVKYRGSGASTGWKLSLWKRADGTSTATTATQIGATQTLVNSGKTVATYNFTDETTVEGTSYWFQLETEVPSGTTTLFSIGIQTTKRGL